MTDTQVNVKIYDVWVMDSEWLMPLSIIFSFVLFLGEPWNLKKKTLTSRKWLTNKQYDYNLTRQNGKEIHMICFSFPFVKTSRKWRKGSEENPYAGFHFPKKIGSIFPQLVSIKNYLFCFTIKRTFNIMYTNTGIKNKQQHFTNPHLHDLIKHLITCN